MAHIRYRPDIDGLRALAVLPVVTYHVGFDLFRGGFIGVDIFFVISGYLIGRGIVEDLEAGRFSIAGFYERRFRRILPALIVMLAVTTALCAAILFPMPLIDYAESLAAAVFSVSNVYFWLTAGYFGPVGESQPLLHTWSLAVEEQYYLLMPLILMLAFRFARRRLVWIIWAIALVSFAVSVVGAFRFPDATFYLLHTRAWELMAGLLAYLSPPPLLARRWLREAIGWLAIAVIVACIIVYRGRYPFPGALALPPVVAAAALIAIGSSGGSGASRLLSWRPLVWIGLISYSLYLWHWPVIVIYKFGLQFAADTLVPKLLLLGGALVLAWLSWRFIERPFRTTRHVGQGAIFAGAALASVLLASIGGLMVLERGMPQRYSPRVQKMLAMMDYSPDAAFRSDVCMFETENSAARLGAVCTATVPGRPIVLLVGDSQAAHLYYGLAHVFGGSNIWQVTGAGCRPTLTDANDGKPRCKALHRAIPEVLARAHPDLILVAGHWYPSDMPQLAEFVHALKARGDRLMISGSLPDYTVPLPALMARDQVVGRSSGPADHLRPDLAEMDSALRRLATREGVGYTSMASALCDHARWPCRTMATAATPMFFDGGHLTPAGSIVVAQQLVGRDPALRTK